MKNDQEIEVRFLNIDIDKIKFQLHKLGAIDKKEVLLEEIIFYDKDLVWRKSQQFVRLRKNGNDVTMSFKRHMGVPDPTKNTLEIELNISDIEKGKKFLESIGLAAFRYQQKKRHTFDLNDVFIDIDTWPKLPPYVEIEGASLPEIKSTAEKLGLRWEQVVFEDAKQVIENYYNIPVSRLKYFTFDRIE